MNGVGAPEALPAAVRSPVRGKRWRELSSALAEVSLVVLPFALARLVGRFVDFLYLGPIAIVVCVTVATALLRARGRRWRDVGLARPTSWRRALLAAAALVAALVALAALLRAADLALGLPAPNLDALLAVRESRLTLWIFLVPVSWGSGAFGEEMVARGFVLNRLVDALGDSRWAWTVAIVVQAALFGLAHGWQGITGVVHATALGALMGLACFRTGGNLWPVILAHGTLDFVTVLLIAGAS